VLGLKVKGVTRRGSETVYNREQAARSISTKSRGARAMTINVKITRGDQVVLVRRQKEIKKRPNLGRFKRTQDSTTNCEE